MSEGFAYVDGVLTADTTPVPDLVHAAGTPLYVYSASMMRARLARLAEAFDGLSPRLHYAVKANSNGAILRLLASCGAGFDLVSGGELERVLRAGAKAADTVFAGVGKQEWELALALEKGVGLFNVESETELDKLAVLAKRAGARARVALRLNPDVDANTHAFITTGRSENKFGLSFDAADRLVARIRDEATLELVAYHVHLGSLLLDAEPYVDAARRVMTFYDEDDAHRDGVRAYNMGGGFGIRGVFDEPLELEALADGMRDLLVPRGLSLLLEPGRYLVGNAGILVASVLHAKEGATRAFLVVDAAMNDFIRPALYGAEHEVRAVVEDKTAQLRRFDVVGPVCESADFLAKDVALPELVEGALVAVFSAGAYGFAMASSYNSRPLPAEVLTGDGAARLVRRRQTREDFWRDEVDEDLLG